MCAPSCEMDCSAHRRFVRTARMGRSQLRAEGFVSRRRRGRPCLGGAESLELAPKFRYGRWRLSAPEDDGPATTCEPTYERCPFSCKLCLPSRIELLSGAR